MSELDIYKVKALICPLDEDVEEETIIHGFLLFGGAPGLPEGKRIAFVTENSLVEDEPPFWEVNPYTICRCIGIKDVKGQYLYEHDVVSYKRPMSDDVEYGTIDYYEPTKAYVIRTSSITRATRQLRECYEITQTGRNILLSGDDCKWFDDQSKKELIGKPVDRSYCPSIFKKSDKPVIYRETVKQNRGG